MRRTCIFGVSTLWVHIAAIFAVTTPGFQGFAEGFDRLQISLAAPFHPPEIVHFLSFKAFCTVVLVHQSGTLSMVLRMAQPIKRGSIYWLRKKVPNDLRPIVGKREEKFSLGTRDPAEARILFAKAAAEIEERWSRLRQGVRSLSHKEAVAMAGEIYRRMVAEQEENPTERAVSEMLLDQYAFGRASATLLGSDKEAGNELLKRMMQKRKVHIAERIDRFLLEEGHRIDPSSRASLQKHFENAILKAREHTVRMSKGDYSPDPAASSFPPYTAGRVAENVESTTPGIKLSVALKEWIKEKTRKDGDWVATTATSYMSAIEPPNFSTL